VLIDRVRLVLFALMLPAVLGISHAGEPPGNSPVVLTVQGPTGEALGVTADQWKSLPRVSVTAVEHGGEQARFEGVPVAEILRLVDAPLGRELSGRNLRLYVLAQASDGYEVVFALAEFDSAFSDRVILIADRRNGEPIGPTEGPLRFVVPGDKRQARWIRKLQTISVRSAP